MDIVFHSFCILLCAFLHIFASVSNCVCVYLYISVNGLNYLAFFQIIKQGSPFKVIVLQHQTASLASSVTSTSVVSNTLPSEFQSYKHASLYGFVHVTLVVVIIVVVVMIVVVVVVIFSAGISPQKLH